MDRTTLTRNLRSLVNQQMISIGSDAADGRVRRARITGKGNNVFQDAQPFWHHAQAFVATTLGKEHLRALHAWLARDIGRAACRARVCQYGLIAVVGVPLK